MERNNLDYAPASGAASSKPDYPAATSALPGRDMPHRGSAKQLPSDPEGIRTQQGKDARIAIVDGDHATVQIVQKYLEDAGYHSLLKTTDPAEAVNLILREPPDLALLGISMPVISGLDILRVIKTVDQAGHVPVLFLTAADEPEVKGAAIELGVTDFLQKPVDPNELIPRVRNALLTKTYQDQLAQENARLEAEVKRRTAELVASREEVIHCLARTAEYRDNDSGQHVVRVGRYVGIIARELGFAEEQVELLELAARLHDLGKIAIPDSILQHPEKLDPDQVGLIHKHCDIGQQVLEPTAEDHWRTFRSHVRLGAGLLHVRSSPLLMLAAKIAQTHHERWDGTGYPLGLAGEDIPIEGRMTAVADVYDTLSSRRPYKRPFPREKCCAIMEDGRGTQFDPNILDAFFTRKREIIEIQIQYMDVE